MKKTNNVELYLEPDETQENGVLVTYDITSYPSDHTLRGIYDMWKSEDITIPEFQREFVWTIHQSSLLIESFLLGLPVPPVFFYIDPENKNLVIDGQQRILSVIFYFDGYFGIENLQGRKQVFRLTGLNERSPYHKKRFLDLNESAQRKLKQSVLRAINIRQLKPSGENTSIYHIFERLNTGGTPLKPQEIRNVVFRGEIVQVLRNLNNDKNWRLILGRKPLDKHQRDVELVLRLFALSNREQEYEKPMKEFLNRAMQKNRKANHKEMNRFCNLFNKTTKFIIENLGEKPFHVRGPLNTSALDSVFCTLLDNFNKKPRNLKERFDKLLKSSEFEELTTLATTDASILKKRFKLTKSRLID